VHKGGRGKEARHKHGGTHELTTSPSWPPCQAVTMQPASRHALHRPAPAGVAPSPPPSLAEPRLGLGPGSGQPWARRQRLRPPMVHARVVQLELQSLQVEVGFLFRRGATPAPEASPRSLHPPRCRPAREWRASPPSRVQRGRVEVGRSLGEGGSPHRHTTQHATHMHGPKTQAPGVHRVGKASSRTTIFS